MKVEGYEFVLSGKRGKERGESCLKSVGLRSWEFEGCMKSEI
jgi:hypothetical protein